MREYALGAGYAREASLLASCGGHLVFRYYYPVDKIRLHRAFFCHQHLICPLCAIRRAAKMLKAYLQRYQVVITQYPHLKPYLVTLTVTNGPDLAERLMHLRAGLRRMMRARRNYQMRGGKSRPEFAKSWGGFHSIEVTNQGKGWHPHVHMVWLCEEPPNGRALSREWRDWTGDSYVVDVRPIRNLEKGFAEVLKYAVKLSTLTLAEQLQAYEVLRGVRLIDSHGLMRGVEVPEDDGDEDLDSLPYVDLFYRYLDESGYTLTEVKGDQVPGEGPGGS